MVHERGRRSSTVLVIDDEESIREGCRQLLEYQGYRVAVVSDGEWGLRLVEQTRPDLVLVDLRMPGMDGLEVLRRIRRTAPGIATIIITGYAAVESATEAMRLGACDYIGKPFDEKELLAAVECGLETADLKPPPSVGLAPPARTAPEKER